MNPSGVELLRSLGSGILPPGVDAAARRAPVESMGFAELLNKARSGTMESGIAVKVQPGVGVDLSSDQLARLQKAADQAEAEGAARALVVLDGMMLKMDVPTRTIIGVQPPESTGIMTGIDSVIMLGSASNADTKVQTVSPPTKGILGLSPSVLDVLQDR
jgi:hypothetical protein